MPSRATWADPGVTLRTYTHLMPKSEDRTRKAVDLALSSEATAPHVDSLLAPVTSLHAL